MFYKSSLKNQLTEKELSELAKKKGGTLTEEDLTGQLEDFTRKNKNSRIWETNIIGEIGLFLFSFDKEVIFNFWEDYPDNLTLEQIAIFKKEYPDWAEMRS